MYVFCEVLFKIFQEEMFIGLLSRSMKNDVNIKRVAAFSKRLLQVSAEMNFTFNSILGQSII